VNILTTSATKELLYRLFSNLEEANCSRITVITNSGFFTGKKKTKTQQTLDLSNEHLSVQQIDEMQMNAFEYIELEDVVFNPNFMPSVRLKMPAVVLFSDQILGFVYGEVTPGTL
jgi:hypothetical protein